MYAYTLKNNQARFKPGIRLLSLFDIRINPLTYTSGYTSAIYFRSSHFGGNRRRKIKSRGRLFSSVPVRKRWKLIRGGGGGGGEVQYK